MIRLDAPHPVQFCDGLTRRDFLYAGAVPALGLSLSGLARANAAEQTPNADVNCIFVFLVGGPSQLDTFDPKPDAPAEIRGPFQPINTKVPGVRVSEIFPHLAKCADDLAIVRSMYADSFAHGSGLLQMNTGFLRQGYPCLGSWVTYGLGTVNQNLPGFVVMLDHRGGPIGGPPNWNSGFMPATYQGTQFRVSGDPILNLSPPAGVSVAAARSWDGLLRLVRQRPVTAVVIDSASLDARVPGDVAVGELLRRYPSVAMDLIARPHLDPDHVRAMVSRDTHSFELSATEFWRLQWLPVHPVVSSEPLST